MIADVDRSAADAGRRGRPWRLMLGDGAGHDTPTSHDGPLNMATDQALLESVATGADPVLRLYRWSPATLSFGRNQPARGLYDEGVAADRGIQFVRRPTGGQAVLHDDELTYAVVAPVAALGKPRDAYRRINEALLAALRELGLEAGLSGATGGPRGAGPAPVWSDACFRRPERGEVVVRGRKLVGSAQRVESRTILQHGSILLGGTQAPAEALLLDREAVDVGAGDDGGWTTLESELDRRPALDAVVAAVAGGFTSRLGISLARSPLTFEESTVVRRLRPRFASGEWTWRR